MPARFGELGWGSLFPNRWSMVGRRSQPDRIVKQRTGEPAPLSLRPQGWSVQNPLRLCRAGDQSGLELRVVPFLILIF
jgi:hypothetical protein